MVPSVEYSFSTSGKSFVSCTLPGYVIYRSAEKCLVCPHSGRAMRARARYPRGAPLLDADRAASRSHQSRSATNRRGVRRSWMPPLAAHDLQGPVDPIGPTTRASIIDPLIGQPLEHLLCMKKGDELADRFFILNGRHNSHHPIDSVAARYRLTEVRYRPLAEALYRPVGRQRSPHRLGQGTPR